MEGQLDGAVLRPAHPVGVRAAAAWRACDACGRPRPLPAPLTLATVRARPADLALNEAHSA
jgi:hypothetical protein